MTRIPTEAEGPSTGSLARAFPRAFLRDFAALIAGAIFPVSLAPLNYWPVGIASIMLLYVAVGKGSTSRTILRFYLFNLAMFAVGISWIYVSIHTYGGASPALAGGLVALFVTAYATICIPQGYLYARFFRGLDHGATNSGASNSGARNGIGKWNATGFAALWVLQEWFRSWFLTGFPWLFAGYGFLGTPIAAYAPVFGVFGVTFVAVLLSTLIVAGIASRRPLYAIPVILILVGGVALQPVEFTRPGGVIAVSLVQGNVDQHVKWDSGNAQSIISLYENLTSDELGRDLIVWPEAAVTVFKEHATSILAEIDRVARQHGSAILLGIPDRSSTGSYQNTLLAVGTGSGQYIKRRLVPFGEYVPLENTLRGLIELFDLPMSRNVPGPAHQAPIVVGGITLSASICYEVIYPDLVRETVIDPGLLLTVSNDTWFGNSIGPWQHLQMAQMRALENGRSLVRATNNGVTAFIDHRGEIVASLPQFEVGVLRGEPQIRTGMTPFHRFGSLPILGLCVVALLFILAFPAVKERVRVGSRFR